jgi:thioredoxin reductase (NADPH)
MVRKILLFFIFSLSLHAQTTPVVILGGGIAGMTAALQVSQAGLQPLVVVGPTPGGIITVSPGVENWPGDLSITGVALADKLEQQLEMRGVKMMSGVVTSVDFSKRPFTILVKDPILSKESVINAECCIVTLGATPNQLQVPGEKNLLYNKIFTCAPCDGLRFRDQTVAVIGGGESALIEAHYLSNIAKQVIVIVRGKAFKTIQPALKEKLLSNPKVKVLFQTTVQEFEDDPLGVKLRLSKDTLIVQGVFLAIGSHPNTDILKNSLELDPAGYIILKKGQATSIPGVFAAGDVSDPIYKQAISAAGDATKAALEAINFLSSTPTPVAVTKTLPSILEISDLPTLQSTIRSSDKPVVAYFSSPSCMPCRSFKPLYQKWSEQYSSIAKFLKISGDECPACFDAYQVQSIPAVLIIDSKGNVIHRAVAVENMTEIVKYLEKQKSISAP